jgi:dodecin
MDDRVYRVTEIVGSSTESIDQAIRHGLERAQQTLRNLDWFEVTDIRGNLQAGSNPTTQVTMKVGFRLDEQ